jgi:hypothetical protein
MGGMERMGDLGPRQVHLCSSLFVFPQVHQLIGESNHGRSTVHIVVQTFLHYPGITFMLVLSHSTHCTHALLVTHLLS